MVSFIDEAQPTVEELKMFLEVDSLELRSDKKEDR